MSISSTIASLFQIALRSQPKKITHRNTSTQSTWQSIWTLNRVSCRARSCYATAMLALSYFSNLHTRCQERAQHSSYQWTLLELGGTNAKLYLSYLKMLMHHNKEGICFPMFFNMCSLNCNIVCSSIKSGWVHSCKACRSNTYNRLHNDWGPRNSARVCITPFLLWLVQRKLWLTEFTADCANKLTIIILYKDTKVKRRLNVNPLSNIMSHPKLDVQGRLTHSGKLFTMYNFPHLVVWCKSFFANKPLFCTTLGSVSSTIRAMFDWHT